MTAMVPLQYSHAADALEDELRDLFIALYASTLQETADEINVYGAPHLGSVDLIAKNIAADQLVLLRSEEHRVRHLFKAWRHRNPERGLHFLRTYLQALWGDAWQVDQLWQDKSEPYPLALKTSFEADPADDFLTSRIRVDLDIEGFIPDNVIRALRSAIAARFVLKMRIAKFSQMNLTPVTTVSRGVQIARLSGEAVLPPSFTVGVGISMNGLATVFYSTSEARFAPIERDTRPER